MGYLEISWKRCILVLASVIFQSIIGLFLGHHYDIQIFFTSGYVISQGAAPYGLFPAKLIFDHPRFFEMLPGIGYPPPWGLYLGLIYTIIYKQTGSLYAYNLAIKLPSILSTISLAFLSERIVRQEGLCKKGSEKIFYFFLFNPLFIYISSIWGQFDSLVILAIILALNSLSRKKIIMSAILIVFSASLKIIPLVLSPLFIIYIKRNLSPRHFLPFFFSALLSFTVFFYLPFLVLEWDIAAIMNNLGFHFNRAGGFSLFNLIDLFYDTTTLPRGTDFLGYLWIPGLIAGYYALLKTSLKGRTDLYRWAATLIFILFLTRSWVSEQNILLLIPLIILQTAINPKNWKTVRGIWSLTLLFTFLNTSPFQMFFLISDEPLNFIRTLDIVVRIPRLFFKFLIIIPWQILGWSYVIRHIQEKHFQS